MVQLALYKEQYKKTLRLAAPVMLSQVGVSAVQLFDNAMVGQLGALPLAAVSFGGSVFFMVFIFTTGLALGLTPLVGEQYARGRGEEAARYFQNSFVLFGAAGLAAFGVLHALVPLMYHMGQPREVVDMAVPYYRWLVWSILPYMVFCCFKQFLEGVGNTTVNMVIIVTANLINIFIGIKRYIKLFPIGNFNFNNSELITFFNRRTHGLIKNDRHFRVNNLSACNCLNHVLINN